LHAEIYTKLEERGEKKPRKSGRWSKGGKEFQNKTLIKERRTLRLLLNCPRGTPSMWLVPTANLGGKTGHGKEP